MSLILLTFGVRPDRAAQHSARAGDMHKHHTEESWAKTSAVHLTPGEKVNVLYSKQHVWVQSVETLQLKGKSR